MRRLDSQELQTVSGGDCYCCCRRKRQISGYEALRIGKYQNISECMRDSWESEECSGYVGCYEDSSHCSNIESDTLERMLSSPDLSLWLNPDLAHLSELVRQF